MTRTAKAATAATVATGTVLAAGFAGAAAAAGPADTSSLTAGAATSTGAAHVRNAAAVLGNDRQLPIHDFDLSSGFGHSSGPHAGRNHAGLDFAAPTGTPLYASVSGQVRIAGPYGGYGSFVSIKTTSGGELRYGHMSKVLVRKGQHVDAGQQIGRVGSTGYSTGPHLHFEVLTSRDRAVDPLAFLGVDKRTLVQLEHTLSRGHRR